MRQSNRWGTVMLLAAGLFLAGIPALAAVSETPGSGGPKWRTPGAEQLLSQNRCRHPLIWHPVLQRCVRPVVQLPNACPRGTVRNAQGYCVRRGLYYHCPAGYVYSALWRRCVRSGLGR